MNRTNNRWQKNEGCSTWYLLYYSVKLLNSRNHVLKIEKFVKTKSFQLLHMIGEKEEGRERVSKSRIYIDFNYLSKHARIWSILESYKNQFFFIVTNRLLNKIIIQKPIPLKLDVCSTSDVSTKKKIRHC